MYMNKLQYIYIYIYICIYDWIKSESNESKAKINYKNILVYKNIPEKNKITNLELKKENENYLKIWINTVVVH